MNQESLTSLSQNLGYATVRFQKKAGIGHSSTNDKLDVNIKSGQKFYITISQTGSENKFPVQLFGWLNGVSSRITGFSQRTSNTREAITAASDFDQLSVYIGNDMYSGSAELTLLFETEESKLIDKTIPLKADIIALEELTKKIDTDINGLSFLFVDTGKNAYYNSSGNRTSNNNYSYGFADVSGASKLIVDTTELGQVCIINVCDQNKEFIRNIANFASPNKYTVQIETGEVYICVSANTTTEFEQITIKEANSIEESIVYKINSSEEEISLLNRKTKEILIPILRNGSLGNASNANSISTQHIIPIDHSKDKIIVEYLGDTSLADEYAWSYGVFRGATDGMTSSAAFADSSITKYNYNQNATIRTTSTKFELPLTNVANYDHIMFYLWRYDNGTVVPLRIDADQYSFKITYKEKNGIQNQRDVDLAETKHYLLFAKHAKNNTETQLILLHFSDIHGDTAALARIIKDTEGFEYDDAICTGDIVTNTANRIESWWDESVLTCIGNHDSASYTSTDGYNWVALNMADRDAYYITPFKSNWGGVVHTSGKSYYYKDYTDAKVRLIVMDAMLYSISETDTSLATEQTTWLNLYFQALYQIIYTF